MAIKAPPIGRPDVNRAFESLVHQRPDGAPQHGRVTDFAGAFRQATDKYVGATARDPKDLLAALTRGNQTKVRG